MIVLELLSHAGIPVARLADEVGVNRAITHRHLHGPRKPSPEMVQDINRAVGQLLASKEVEAYLNAVYESAGPPRRFRFYRAIDLAWRRWLIHNLDGAPQLKTRFDEVAGICDALSLAVRREIADATEDIVLRNELESNHVGVPGLPSRCRPRTSVRPPR